MEITRELLDQQIDNLQKQIAGYQGALEFAQMMRGALDRPENSVPKDEMTTQEFAEMAVGPGARAGEIQPNGAGLPE